MNLRLAVAVLALLAAGVAVWMIAAPTGTPEAHVPELRRGNGSEPDSLDPQRARMDSALTILRDCYEGLVSLAPDGSLAAGAAESWSVSEDGRAYTFRLRPDARWSNGDAVVAADFVFAFQRLVDPATASQYALMLEPVRNATEIVAGRLAPDTLGVEAPDEATFIVRLAAPSGYFLSMLAHPSTFPVHRPTLAARPQDFARPGVAVTNGAFVPDDWQIGSEIVARRNDHYRAAAQTRIGRVRYLHTADPVAELTRYRAGDLDITYSIPPGEAARLRRDYPDELRISTQLAVYYYGFALDRPPFADAPLLRRALAMAVDREVLATRVLGDGEPPALGWVPDGVAGYRAQRFEWSTMNSDARLAEARRLYAAAGYSAARPLEFELRYNKSPLHDRIAIAVSAMWRQNLGAVAKLRAEDFRVLKQAIDAREVQAFRGSWVGDYNDAYSFLQVLQGGFGINLPRYRNEAYDALLAAARMAPDAGRAEALAAAERQLLADVPLVPLFFYVSKHLVSPRVQGWYDNVMNVTYSKDLSLRE